MQNTLVAFRILNSKQPADDDPITPTRFITCNRLQLERAVESPNPTIHKALLIISRRTSESMDASTALALEGVADRAVAMELTRAEALTMAAQVMRGVSAMVLGGEHPAHIKEKTSTPGGCTFGGLLVPEENAVRGSTPRTLCETTVIASQLGQGMKNMNGTRF
ncbi:hypothetical protein BJX62DRAFT_148657 [Aspergillus germanicus]